ncbi:MAG: DNA internalization-related competence protein ComEC/Rec2 [Mogibacterium sp.]|nr:DNA internalization-related competence protein ComEC/Rec2 [Mogibacterium sp.]
MIRRKLFAYTMMFASGVSAGFFVFERTRIAGGALIMVSICVMTYTCFDLAENERRRLAAFLAAGFVLFTCRYISYGCSLISSCISDDAEKMISVCGTADSVTVKDEGLRIVLSDTDIAASGVRVIVSLYNAGDTDIREIPGRRITAYGKLREPPGADNPGCFDYRIYLRSRGIGYAFSAKSLEISDDGPVSVRARYKRWLFETREDFLDRFSDPEIRAFIKGAVFGDKSDISEETLEDFTANGTGHILAVSGLHTGFLYSLLRFLQGRRRTLPAAAFVIMILIMYGDMTLWSPSTMRAVTVLTVSLLSMYARRPFDLLSAVSASALLILLIEPYQLMSTGFQMSFLALLGIAFLAEPLSHFTGGTYAGDMLAAAVSVQAGILPLTAMVFHRINILSVFINIPVIFMASVIVPGCMMILFIMMAAGTVPGFAVLIIEGLSEIIMRFNSTVSAGGYFSGLITSAGIPVLVLVYLFMMLTASEWTRIKLLRREYRGLVRAYLCILAFSVCLLPAAYNTFSDDEIVFVSVGQGDCTHIRAGGKDILIDGGGDTERNIGEDVLMPYLLANGAERAELACVTHLHTDHALGILQLSQEYPVGAICIPSDYRKSLESRQRSTGDTEDILPGLMKEQDKVQFIGPGSRIHITDDVYIDTIWPVEERSDGIDIDDPNEHNMVYMINYRGIKIMVTGDLLEEDELKMIEYYRNKSSIQENPLKCDVLKVAHHGSKSSSSEAFLDAVSPSVAVVQVGANNFYGHPHQQTIDRLEARGIPVYRTDLNGAAGIDIRGGKIRTVDTMR